jgi:hypothetical protein
VARAERPAARAERPAARGGATGGTGGATGGTGGATGGTGGATGGTGGATGGTGGATGGTGGGAGDGGTPECTLSSECDNGQYCDGAETCVNNKCVPGAPIVCTSDGKSCTTETCDEVSDTCKTVYSDTACADGNWCNGVETCDPTKAGANATTGCAPGTAVNCSDSISCTVDACDETSDQCTHSKNDNACGDSQWCNGVETCNPGTSGASPTTGCVAGTAPSCEDGLGCTADSCNETTDTCDHAPNNNACQDGLYCNGQEVCDLTQGCKAGAAVSCPNTDNLTCTVESCNEATDTCDTAVDNTKCTNGQICSPSGGTPPSGCITLNCTTGADCTDNNACNGVEWCDTSVQGGQCKPGTAVSCNDSIPCTLDECNPTSGQCSHTPFNAFCSDGNLCNGVETCSTTLGCQAGTPLSCSDGKSCTIDSCIASIGCFYQPNDAACQDSSTCNGAEACDPTAGNANAATGCVPSPGPLVCPDTDGIACTQEQCVEGAGCVSQPNNSLCGCRESCVPSLGGCGEWCTPGTCQGKTYACGDCLDNDNDCKVDSQDPHCIGTCSNNETGFKGEISGQNNAACKMDCYFDQDSGAGNDDCHWDHRCDPNTPQGSDGCAYDPNHKFPGNKSCTDYFNAQSAQCAGNMSSPTPATGYCGPLVPNGCDCFGCCVFPQVSYPVYLGSSQSTQSPGTCNMNTLNDPTKCKQCVQVPSCLNTCGNCELCVGKPTLPPECTEQTCPAGKQKCGLPGQSPCPSGQDPRHQRPALRQRPHPPRPPGRVHPDRHLGALPEACAATAAVYLCADDTHGTAIMLRARQGRRTEEALIADMRRRATWPTSPASASSSTTTAARTATKTRSLRGSSGRPPQGRARRASVNVEQLLRPGRSKTFLADRFVKGKCPKCGTPDQYGDNCEKCFSTYSATELVEPYSVFSGAEAELRRASIGSFVTDDEHGVLGRMDATAAARCRPTSRTGFASAFSSTKPLHDWDVSRPAPYFGFEIPDAPGNYWYVWFDAPIGYIASTQEWCKTTGESLDDWWQNPPCEIITSSAKTSRGSTRCSGR